MDGAGAGAKQKRAADADAATANSPLLNLSDDVFREVLACVPADDLIAGGRRAPMQPVAGVRTSCGGFATAARSGVIALKTAPYLTT